MNKPHITPGPWYISDESPYDIVTRPIQRAYPVATSASVPFTTPDERKANARAIAALPDVLEALHRILAAHDSGNNGAVMGEAVLCRQFATHARAALTKAGYTL